MVYANQPKAYVANGSFYVVFSINTDKQERNSL